MAEKTYAEILKSSLDLRAIDRYFREDRSGKLLEVLQRLRPEGRVDGGRFKLASMEGGAGSSTDFNLQNTKWGDWSNSGTAHGEGLISFAQATLKCTAAQAVKFLIDEKFLDSKDAKKSLNDADGDPLVLPIPEEKASWEYVLEQDILRKDRGIINGHWTYKDVDGALLGYKYRVDGRNTTKEVYTLSFRAQSGWTKKAWQKKLVPLYGMEKLRGSPTVRIMLVEGEKAADAAQELLGARWKVLAFSGVSASHDLWMPDEKFWEDCEVVLWPDNDQAGREAMRRVQLQLERLRNKPREIRIVRVEAIPGLPPKWDLADWTPDSGVDIKAEIERAEEVDSFERICREYVYVTRTDQFYNLIDRHLIFSPSAFDRRYSMYGDKSGKPSAKFLCDRGTLKVEDEEFLPGEQTFVTSAQGKVFLNTWFPTPVYLEAQRIAADEDISDEEIYEKAHLFVEHVQRISCGAIAEPDVDAHTKEPKPDTEGREVSDALYLYFSNIIRRPMDKSGWVPTLLSASNGTGKSYFRFMVQSILGGDRTAALKAKQYVSQYDDWKDGVLFYEVEEVKAHDSAEIYDEIKKNHNHRPFHFSANSDRMANTLKLNIKSRGMKTQRDFLNGMVTSNDLYPMVLGSTGDSTTDRRLFVVRAETRLETPESNALYGELETSPEWVGAWLMRFKPKYEWNPSWAPVTAHKRLMFEKDRERSEARSDKTELGRYDEFFHFLNYAKMEKVGGFAREVVAAETIREICELRRIRFPYDVKRFDKLLEKSGFHKGPEFKVDGIVKRCYATEPTWLAKGEKQWKEELAKSINNVL